jgi:murein DD-endopeptidase MepM/ murein hydrolase activator NlpD
MGRFSKFLCVVLASPLLAACMPDSPETQLTWDANTRMGAAHHRAAATGEARTYTYEDGAPQPTPRPAPNYVTKNVTPYTTVTSAPLAPVGSSSVAFAWPVNGNVISNFGATTNGEKNDGINIAAAMNTPIHASASGTVTYAGNELKGYGNLVLLKHSGGYTTAYANADHLVVARGDFVAKGQVIGYTGQTGDVTSPQLHFEIRTNTTPVNPRSYLTTQQARS